MSEPEQGRRGGAPADTPDIRRLRVVSAFTDPFLVTKLPQETSVVSGVIRLGERTVLGFLHQPFPDGTRVRVVYREWLLAERIEAGDSESETSEGIGESEGEGDLSAGEGAAGTPAEEVDSAEPPAFEPVEPPAEAVEAATGRKGEDDVVSGPTREVEADSSEAGPVGSDSSSRGQEKVDSRAQRPGEPVEVDTDGQGPDEANSSERSQVEPRRKSARRKSRADDDEGQDGFPEDLTGTDDEDDARTKGDDPWTDAFRRGGKRRRGKG